MSVKVKVFLFICLLFALCIAFNNQSSSALRKENNASQTAAKASPTPKAKSSKPRKQRNQRKSEGPIACYFVPLNLTLSTSTLYLPCDKNTLSNSTVDNNYVVGVAANASEPKEGKLIYRYGVTGGTVIGEGGNVQWDLSNLPEGKYQITALVDNGKGFTTQTKEVEIVKCNSNTSSSSQDSAVNNKTIEAYPTPTPETESSKPRKQRNRRKSSQQVIIDPPKAYLATSTEIVYLPCDDGNYSSECPNNQVINVSAGATEPNGDSVLYTYKVSVGKIIGEGGNVQWDLSGVLEGKYKITVVVKYKNGYAITQEKEIEVVKCKCKPTQTSLDFANDKQITPSPTLSPTPDENNCNRGFMFGTFILTSCHRENRVSDIPNTAPLMQSRLATPIVYLPCDDKNYSSDYQKKYQIDVFTWAHDADGDTLLYIYNVTGGKIIGSGSNVKWDLSSVLSGIYTIVAQVDDGKGAVTEQVLEIEVIRFGCPQTK